MSRARATAEELAPQIEPALKAANWEGGTAPDFLRTIRDESVLLTGWGPEQFGFMHLSFQEHLAAREVWMGKRQKRSEVALPAILPPRFAGGLGKGPRWRRKIFCGPNLRGMNW